MISFLESPSVVRRATYSRMRDSAGQLLITAGQNTERLHSEGAFAMLCGVAPIPASSGKTNRHRLNRGGDRQANAALYRVVLSRMRWDPGPTPFSASSAGLICSTRGAIKASSSAISSLSAACR
jgi:transposase